MSWAEFQVHDTLVQELVTMQQGKGVSVIKQITYYVGPHGPFTLRYAPADYNVERVTADMQAEVAVLKALAQSQG